MTRCRSGSLAQQEGVAQAAREGRALRPQRLVGDLDASSIVPKVMIGATRRTSRREPSSLT
jgi:hypothetical protein